MILLIIFVVLLVFIILVGWVADDGEGAFYGGAFSFIFLSLLFLGIQGLGMTTNTTANSVHSHKIVSIADGKGVNGSISGGIFVMSGSINDTQHFAYYQEKAPKTFTLEKRDATASTIHTDATPETARIDVTDTVTTCKKRWWYICDESKPVEVKNFHSDFHVPANSITNEFKLDTQ